MRHLAVSMFIACIVSISSFDANASNATAEIIRPDTTIKAMGSNTVAIAGDPDDAVCQILEPGTLEVKGFSKDFGYLVIYRGKPFETLDSNECVYEQKVWGAPELLSKFPVITETFTSQTAKQQKEQEQKEIQRIMSGRRNLNEILHSLPSNSQSKP
ncbi:MAG: hypothetical protein GYB52_19930 [Rhodospirillales bacterium]|nr:hypothetical protein [Rhodospirillales bacterium]